MRALAALLAANASAPTYVRLVTRYQPDGTLVAARVYTSTSFNTVFNNPEGHVLHVSGAGATPSFWVENEKGLPVKVNVATATRFYFHTPASATAGVTPISGSDGVAFMNSGYLKRGFKVHVTVDPADNNTADVVPSRAAGGREQPGPMVWEPPSRPIRGPKCSNHVTIW